MQGSSVSFCDLMAHFLLALKNVPLCGCTTFCSSIHLSKDILFFFPQILAIMNKTVVNMLRFLCGHGFSAHLHKYLGVQLLRWTIFFLNN